ncbi:TolC family protein [bacterium]|nr:TolC family protein [bacterium]
MKRNHIIPAILLVLLIPALLLAQQEAEDALPASKVTLSELEDMALQRNAGITASRLRYDAAREQETQTTALPDTKVGFGYFVQPVETRLGPQRASISVSQSFPWFGTLGAEENAAEARSRQQHTRIEDTRLRVLLDLRRSWYQLYVLHRSEDITRQHLALVRSLREIAFSRYETGKQPFSHLLRLDAEIAKLETSLEDVVDDRRPLLRELSRLVRHDVRGDMLLLPDSLPIPVVMEGENALDQRTRQHPRLRELEEEGRYWSARGSAAEKQGYPSFTLGLTYTSIAPRDDIDVPDNGRDAIIPQVGVSFPLFGSRYGAMEEEAQLRARAADAEREELQQRFATQLSARMRDLGEARRALELAKRLEKLSRETLDVLMKEYSTGSAGIEDLLTVERDVLRHALDGERARTRARIAADEIEYLTAQDKE